MKNITSNKYSLLKSGSLIALASTLLFSFASWGADQKQVDEQIRKAIKLYNGIDNTTDMLNLMKVVVNENDAKFLDKELGKYKNQRLSKAYYYGNSYIYFEGSDKPLQVINFASAEFAYQGHIFKVTNDIRTTVAAVEGVLPNLKKVSLIDLLLPRAQADDSGLFEILGGAMAVGGLSQGGTMGQIAGGLGSALLGYGLGKSSVTCQPPQYYAYNQPQNNSGMELGGALGGAALMAFGGGGTGATIGSDLMFGMAGFGMGKDSANSDCRKQASAYFNTPYPYQYYAPTTAAPMYRGPAGQFPVYGLPGTAIANPVSPVFPATAQLPSIAAGVR